MSNCVRTIKPGIIATRFRFRENKKALKCRGIQFSVFVDKKIQEVKKLI